MLTTIRSFKIGLVLAILAIFATLAMVAFAQTTWSYTPVFTPGVTINGPTNVSVGTNPQYCLSTTSATQLAQLPAIGPYISGIGYADPFQLTSGPFTTSALCPYFVYVNGAAENAAIVAQIFTHGYPWATDIQQATAEITAVMQAFAAGNFASVQVTGVQPVPAVSTSSTSSASTFITTPPVALNDPVGQQLPDGRYQDLSGNLLSIGANYTDARGSFTKAGTLTPFGTVYWWVLASK